MQTQVICHGVSKKASLVRERESTVIYYRLLKNFGVFLFIIFINLYEAGEGVISWSELLFKCMTVFDASPATCYCL